MKYFIYLFCSSLLLTGCNFDTRSQQDKLQESGFIYCAPKSIVNLNPQLSNGGILLDTIGPQIFDTLLVIDENEQIKPNLATKWQVSPDKKQYTFKLRKDVAFQTTPWFKPTRMLNAQDILFSFNRIIKSKHAYHYVNQGHYPLFSSINFKEVVQNIRIIDPYTIQFTLKQPNSSFLNNLASSFAVIHSKEYADKLAQKHQKRQLDKRPIGTGPFQLSADNTRHYIRLVRNPNYWGEKAKMAQIVFKMTNHSVGALAQLAKKECDVIATPISNQLSLIEKNANYHLDIDSNPDISFISLNTQHYALSNVQFRQALYYAIDKQKIIDSVYYDHAKVAISLMPDNFSQIPSINKMALSRQESLQKAKNLLDSSNVELPLELTLNIQNVPNSYNPSPKKTAELIQSDLAKIGIGVKIIQGAPSRRQSNINEIDDFDMQLTGWHAANRDPNNTLRPLLSCKARNTGFNTSNWCNRRFDQILNQATQTFEQKPRQNLYLTAQKIIDKQMPIIPLAHTIQYRIYQDSLLNIRSAHQNANRFNQVARK